MTGLEPLRADRGRSNDLRGKQTRQVRPGARGGPNPGGAQAPSCQDPPGLAGAWERRGRAEGGHGSAVRTGRDCRPLVPTTAAARRLCRPRQPPARGSRRRPQCPRQVLTCACWRRARPPASAAAWPARAGPCARSGAGATASGRCPRTGTPPSAPPGTSFMAWGREKGRVIQGDTSEAPAETRTTPFLPKDHQGHLQRHPENESIGRGGGRSCWASPVAHAPCHTVTQWGRYTRAGGARAAMAGL